LPRDASAGVGEALQKAARGAVPFAQSAQAHLDGGGIF
jgi:hypothetical protein